MQPLYPVLLLEVSVFLRIFVLARASVVCVLYLKISALPAERRKVGPLPHDGLRPYRLVRTERFDERASDRDKIQRQFPLPPEEVYAPLRLVIGDLLEQAVLDEDRGQLLHLFPWQIFVHIKKSPVTYRLSHSEIRHFSVLQSISQQRQDEDQEESPSRQCCFLRKWSTVSAIATIAERKMAVFLWPLHGSNRTFLNGSVTG
jgi:hypothetical protein